MPAWRLVAGGAELRVRATPNASKDAIENLIPAQAVDSANWPTGRSAGGVGYA